MPDEKEYVDLTGRAPAGEGGDHETSPPRGDLRPDYEAEADEVGKPAGSVVEVAGHGPNEDREYDGPLSTDPDAKPVALLPQTVDITVTAASDPRVAAGTEDEPDDDD